MQSWMPNCFFRIIVYHVFHEFGLLIRLTLLAFPGLEIFQLLLKDIPPFSCSFCTNSFFFFKLEAVVFKLYFHFLSERSEISVLI